MTKKIQVLKDNLFEKSGIDLEKYRDNSEEISEKIAETITFPIYFISTIIKPVIISLLLYVILGGVLLFQGNSVFSAIFLIIVGLIPLFLVALNQGLVNFLKRVEEDITGILSLSLDVVRSILDDIKASNRTIEMPPPISEIISGVILIVILPTMSKIIRKKIPVMGNFVAKNVDRVLEKLTTVVIAKADSASIQNVGTVRTIEEKQTQIADAINAKQDEYYEASLNVLGNIKETSDNIIKELFIKVTIPFRWSLKIGYLFTFLYLIAIFYALN